MSAGAPSRGVMRLARTRDENCLSGRHERIGQPGTGAVQREIAYTGRTVDGGLLGGGKNLRKYSEPVMKKLRVRSHGGNIP